MKIILVAGGSGGHIYPCLELAKYLKENNEQVLLCGSINSLEEKIYKENGFEFQGVKINKKKISSHFINYKKINKIYKEFKPDLVILFGNYISVSFAMNAIVKKIPIFLHEQNVIYGLANKLLGYKAKRIYLSLPINKNVHSKKSVLVGNPKSDIKVKDSFAFKSRHNVTIVMGSLGSITINNLLKEFIKIANSDIDYHIVVGNKYYDEFRKNLDIKNNIHIYPYLDNLASYMKKSDIFISRAGATTISEILVNGACSILIPSPYVKNNHQYLNAKYLKDNNASILIEESKLDAFKLNEEINKLINDYKKRLDMKMNARKLAVLESKKKIYEDIKKYYDR